MPYSRAYPAAWSRLRDAVGTCRLMLRAFAIGVAGLLLAAPVASAGDASSAPTPLTSGIAASADLRAFGVEPGEQNTTVPFGQQCGAPYNVGVARTAWYTIQSGGGPVIVTTGGSDFDTALFVYSGSPAGAMVACNDDTSDSNTQSSVSFTSPPGATYLIQVGRACNETGPPKCADIPDAGQLSITATAAATAPVGDADGDGYVGPTLNGPDCNDTNAAIHPGAADVPHDGVDQDCSGKDAPYPALEIDTSASVNYAKRHTLMSQLRVTGAPVGASIAISCTSKRRGCTFTRKTVTVKSAGTQQLGKYVRKAKLKKGAVVTVLVTKQGFIGASVRYSIRIRKLPLKTVRCVQPGSTKPQTACA